MATAKEGSVEKERRKTEERGNEREEEKAVVASKAGLSAAMPAPRRNDLGFAVGPCRAGPFAAILKRNSSAVVSEPLPRNFLELRDEHLSESSLFEDPLFPATDSAQFSSGELPFTCEWKRPPVSTVVSVAI
ncbi:hypothetical protein COCON_G00017900 [Conger conger]|uniref:Uncharacterized protein n=1 Tax=Conger conger TaxID=82655 RepID=A0A9Q1E3T3_CONCO|nr:hypothetical protein COCON_G00017900 [Conger conger]